MMNKRPFVIFCLVVALLVTGILYFIQSARFAAVLKSVVSRYLPKDLGIGGDFSEVSVQFYPPGFSMKNPKIWVQDQNPLQLPGGSAVEANRIDFTFRPLQIFSGDIRVHQIRISEGQVRLAIDPTQQILKKGASLTSTVNRSHLFHWEDLFRIRADAVALDRVEIKLGLDPKELGFHGLARSVTLSRSEGQSVPGYNLEMEINQIQGKWLNLKSTFGSIESLRTKGHLSESGVEIEELSLIQPGLSIEAPGRLTGDVLNLKGRLEADLRVKANGDLGLLAKGYSDEKKNPVPHGRFIFDGKLGGNLLKPMETLKIGGTVQLDDLRFQNWKAQLVQAKLKWEASPKGGELNVESGSVSSSVAPRSDPDHPGEGGRIEFGPVRWELGTQRPLSLPLKFEHAHLHWLAAPGIESLFPLDFRLNGETHLTFKPKDSGKSWEIHADLKNWLEDFQLDNQRYKKMIPVRPVFQIPKIFLDGQVVVDSTGIRANHLDISLPHSVLRTSGKFDFSKGYDLTALGNLELDDLGKISGNEIHGKGGANIHVHGLPVGVLVDVDLDVKGGQYLNLALGSILGRITWDDHNARLIFSKAHLKRGETEYSVNGTIDVGAADQINLDVQVPRGDIQDFIQIFGRLTQNLSWFPHSLNGPFEGALQVRGGLSFPKLVVTSEMEGKDWELYGEKFRTVHLVGGYDRGTYLIEDFKSVKSTGEIRAKLSFDEGGKIEWKLDTQHLTISDFDYLAQSDIPLRGDMTLHSEGKGLMGQVESSTDWSLNRFSIRGSQMPSSQTSLTTRAGVARWIGSYFGGQADVNAVYDVNPKGLSSIRMALSQLDVSPFLLLINKKAMQDPQLAGFVSGDLDLRFQAGSFEKANGSFQISDSVVANSDVRFQLDHPVRVDVIDGNFDINQLTILGKNKKATLDLKNRKDSLTGRIQGELDHSWVYFFVPSVTQVRGASVLDFAIGGSIKEPSIEGEMRFNGGELRVEALESPFENLAGKLSVKQNVLKVLGVRADLGGGRVALNGEVLLSSQHMPSIELKASIHETKVKVYPFQYAKVSGQLGVHGSLAPYLIDGNVVIDSALFREKMLNQKRMGDTFKAVQYLPVPSIQGKAPVSLFNLAVGLEAPHGVLVQNDLFRDVLAKGKMTLVNTIDTPRVLGRLEIAQGNLVFKAHSFQIQSASALFDSPTVINPSFDLIASTEASGVKIQMYATGRKNDIKIEMTSNPSMPEPEIFSLLALGLTSSDAKRLSATDLGLIQQGEAASLVLHSLDFNRELEDRTGFQVLVDEAVNRQQGVSAFRSQTQNESIGSPQITIKRKFGDRFSVSAGSTMGMGSSRSNQFNIDYAVNSGFSINGNLSNYGSNSSGLSGGAYGATDTQSAQTQNSLGIDLKFITRFR